MNTFPHKHTVRISIPGTRACGRIDYGDQHGYLHLMRDERPSYWPDWYTRLRTRWLIKKLIRKHDRLTRELALSLNRPDPVKAVADQFNSKLADMKEGWADQEAHLV